MIRRRRKKRGKTEEKEKKYKKILVKMLSYAMIWQEKGFCRFSLLISLLSNINHKKYGGLFTIKIEYFSLPFSVKPLRRHKIKRTRPICLELRLRKLPSYGFGVNVPHFFS
jgi:hypothetical protein